MEEDKKSFFSEPKIKNFFNALESNNAKVESVEVLSSQRKKNGELLFAYLKIDGTDSENNKLLPYIFIRGDAVVIVPIIHIENEIYFLCVEQIRLSDGSRHLEFPAGMLDENVDNPAMVAVKELAEETGLKINENQLIPLNNGKPLFTSPGACDEKIYYFKVDIQLTKEEFAELNGKLLKNAEENENITIKICTKSEFLAETKSNLGFVAVSLL
jgi:8-oxo-dGTP pyrophosphatase MutT (NUDIX family)